MSEISTFVHNKKEASLCGGEAGRVAGAAGKNNISRLLYFLFCYCENVSG